MEPASLAVTVEGRRHLQRHADTYADADSHTYPDADAYSYAYADAHSYADAHTDTWLPQARDSRLLARFHGQWRSGANPGPGAKRL